MTESSAEYLVKQFASLQGRLVRKFLDKYRPKDRERFLDISNGYLMESGASWSHQRHGAGVTFVRLEGIRVNAHVAMVEYPEGIDGGRLFEYLESLGVASVHFEGIEYSVAKHEMDKLMDQMARSGLLRPVVSSGRFAHRLFELAQESPVSES
ncbi:DUF6896 domain-containing protein [Sorangium cellulosum]|uniref:DUF6896 domain-containing protein n=1 Tax=Sorangium cellulosum TaxID=56 RepID=UPI0012DB4842|nr:hypothetical protein [Sorangium cellulosum]